MAATIDFSDFADQVEGWDAPLEEYFPPVCLAQADDVQVVVREGDDRWTDALESATRESLAAAGDGEVRELTVVFA